MSLPPLATPLRVLLVFECCYGDRCFQTDLFSVLQLHDFSYAESTLTPQPGTLLPLRLIFHFGEGAVLRRQGT